MTESITAVAVTQTDLECGWATEKSVLFMRFKPDAFDAAADLLEIGDSMKIILYELDRSRLYEAFAYHEWMGVYLDETDRTFSVLQYLWEDQEVLERFVNKVLPHLDVCFLGSKADINDPRLDS